jgi:ubiquinone/menaquinone biosynthesis C-methylase UbiE
MVLTRDQARTFYDHFGKRQDTQAFYEDPALDDLVAHAQFGQAESVFELGCGTGRLALRLLERHLPASAGYSGIDISQTMIDIARQRLSPYKGRASVAQSDGSMGFPLPDGSTDRVISAYVLDLLSDTDAEQAVAEAQRVLTPNGKLCLVSLTNGKGLTSRTVSGLWSMLFRVHAPLVGGCRPIRLESFVRPQSWVIEYRNVITGFGVPSEVLVARPARQ